MRLIKFNVLFMKRILTYSLTATLMLLLVVSCKKQTTPEAPIAAATIHTNNWIYKNMNLYYLWKTYMPTNLDTTKEADPEKYFYKLLYTNLDKWSYITNDYTTLQAELAGNPVTMGYSPAFYLIGTKQVVIVIQYVYPGSAAADAGLKRGDIILSIDNSPLDTTNYYTKYQGTSYSVQTGKATNGTLSFTGLSYNLTARTTLADPSIYDTVFDVNGKKIGYLVYVEFVTGDNDAYLSNMDTIFDSFKAAGVSDLIVDLRYNPGGEVGAAIHLASLIAPSAVTAANSTLINLQYNSDLQAYLTANYPQDLSYKFESPASNINMSHVYFLTTSRSASASELTIVGLKPYMTVTQIGEATYGKYCGSWVIPDDNNQWAIMPMVTKFANSVGFTDFVNGLTPDYAVQDDLTIAVQFGDITDPMVAKALTLISGKSVTGKSLRPSELPQYKQLFPKQLDARKNLLIHGLDKIGK